MRTVHVTPPSFPDAPENTPLDVIPDKVWQVVCGDADHWRAGIFSPSAACLEECPELERHTCPELFLLMEGRLTLVLFLRDGEVTALPLEAGRPVFVTAPHSGFCPDGPHTGRAFVVERDQFSTDYASREGWARLSLP